MPLIRPAMPVRAARSTATTRLVQHPQHLRDPARSVALLCLEFGGAWVQVRERRPRARIGRAERDHLQPASLELLAAIDEQAARVVDVDRHAADRGIRDAQDSSESSP
jgi:hypothetical protein